MQQKVAEARARRLQAAIDDWRKELIDLSGRNPLLSFRDLKRGTLSLDTAEPSARQRLLQDQSVMLTELFDAEHIREAVLAARTIQNKARENYEERGLATLFLALGMATWHASEGQATPCAPVLLRQARLSQQRGSDDDFQLQLDGDWQFNPVLQHVIETQYGAKLPIEELDERLSRSNEYESILRDFAASAADAVAQFDITTRVVLGNFSYEKLPLVQDLEGSGELLAQHPLIAAIAGVEEARNELRARLAQNLDEGAPDLVPPRDEFLVLDADASQNFVINAVVAGSDLVCIGPPGTGKSQTIANLIATLAARGKRVLFVAEKRAAIDAVLQRLEKVGLGDLVLDLHEMPSSRRSFAAQFERALNMGTATPLHDYRQLHEQLDLHRSRLRGHVKAIHERRAPWELSVYEIQEKLTELEGAHPANERLPRSVVLRLDEGVVSEATQMLEQLITLTRPTLAGTQNPWLEAYRTRTVTTRDEVVAVQELLNQVRITLPRLQEELEHIRSHLAPLRADRLADWATVLELLVEVNETLTRFDERLFDLPLTNLGATLAASEKVTARLLGLIGIRTKEYRTAVRELSALARTDTLAPRELRRHVQRAAALAARWHERLSGRPRHIDGADAAARALEDLYTAVEQLSRFVPSLDVARPLSELNTMLISLLDDRQQLQLVNLPTARQLRDDLEKLGLGPFTDQLLERGLTPEAAARRLSAAWLRSILDEITRQDHHIASFSREALDESVKQFREADKEHIKTTPSRILRTVAQRTVSACREHPKEEVVVRAEAAKKRRLKSPRQLFELAPHVLTAAKPCWAMSPLLVAQVLPPTTCFDVVIFDEASQVTPADAIGALMRASRAVVAGDPHQLPPTRFFVAETPEEEIEDDAAAPDGALTRDLESILDVMRAILPPPFGTRTLRWHYRSRDERLIAFSNTRRSLYDGSLITFPGTTPDQVLSHHLVCAAEDDHARPEARHREVDAVVHLVLEHARKQPESSLGIITMGRQHADMIDEALRRARAQHSELDAFFEAHPKEPCFVKNLERVQGDERDAIILTIGYGKLPDGRMQYRFGPLTQEGGERRLNVAITRARSFMTVVSSFSSSDLDPSRLKSEGMRMLADYLAYAESGGTRLAHATTSNRSMNPFERDVYDHLTRAGIPLQPQFGVSGYWIDFAASHPDRPGEMVLAIEADGKSYHSTPTARDRDRLRQEHLERLGWTFHRIWSTSWFRNREAETALALEAWHRAVERADARRHAASPSEKGSARSISDNPTPRPEEPVSHPTRQGPQPVPGGRGSIAEYTSDELVALVRWIESDTLLRTEEELLKEVMDCLGFQRQGARIREVILKAIHIARREAR